MPADLLSLEPVIALALVGIDDDAQEDLRQDVYVRLLAARERLDRTTLDAYAYVVARNLVRSTERRAAAHERALRRVPATESQPGPDEDLRIDDATRAAIRAAWHRLSQTDRDVLQSRDLERRSVHETASDLHLKEGAVRLRTMRARDRLRVRFIVARRGLRLPTPSCEPVLDSLATGDRRRQQQVGAGDHLLHCSTCASLVEDVCERRRSPAWLIWLGAVATSAWLLRAVRTTPSIALGGATVAAVTLFAVLSLNSGDHGNQPSPEAVQATVLPVTAPPPAPTPPLLLDQAPFTPAMTDMSGLAGSTVTATRAAVLEVVGDEAFWVGSTSQERILVVIQTDESVQRVRSGQLATFTGTLVAHGDDFGPTVGVEREEGLDVLSAQRGHVEIDASALVLE